MLEAKAAKSTRRKSSRSNSTSSSSIVTVKRTASLSSKPGSRTPTLPGRAASPDYKAAQIDYNLPSDTYGQSNAAAPELYSSVAEFQEGIGNLNRWSHSTTSSRASTSGQSQGAKAERSHSRRRSFSRRLSLSGSGAFGSAKNSGSLQSSPSRNVLTKPRPSPTKSATSSTATQVPLNTSINKSTAHEGGSNTGNYTPAATDLVTPSARSVDSGDYFSETWQGNSPASSKATTLGPASSRLGSPRDALASKASLHSRAVLSKSSLNSETTIQESAELANRAGHSRTRDGNKGSAGTEDSTSSKSDRGKKNRPQSQKTMLSKALQKANTAVLLDNAQNFELAMEAYEDACRLLEQVMIKSAGEDDKTKLRSIRTTYLNRIQELKSLDSSYHVAGGKALPHRPVSDGTTGSSKSRDSTLSSALYDEDEDEEEVIIATATATRIVNNSEDFDHYRDSSFQQLQPSRSQTLLPSVIPDDETSTDPSSSRASISRNFSRSPLREGGRSETPRGLAPPIMQAEYMPAPLSPRRGLSPNPAYQEQGSSSHAEDIVQLEPSHSRDISLSNESTSWLDTIDESGGSSASSIRSRSSSFGPRHTLPSSQYDYNETEVEFEAALDAAVEAAYDDGYEVADDVGPSQDVDEIIQQNRRNVELAKQRVREAELEAAQAEEARRKHDPLSRTQDTSTSLDYGDDEAEEEERLLEEMTRGYVLDEFQFDLQSKSALPRQSDSSGFSGRTWPSSLGSNTAITSLTPSTDSINSALKQKLPPIRAAPTAALPTPPPAPAAAPAITQNFSRPPSFSMHNGLGVRDRRLSGQNPRQLTIETNQRTRSIAPEDELTLDLSSSNDEPKTATLLPQAQYQPPPPAAAPIPLRTESSMSSMQSQTSENIREDLTASAIEERLLEEEDEELDAAMRPPSPSHTLAKAASAPAMVRKNQSSASLRSRVLSGSTPDAGDVSPASPGGPSFPGTFAARKGVSATVPIMPTPTGNSFTVNGLPTGGMYLFDDHTQQSPSRSSVDSGTETSTSAPLPLEPCPDAFLLRPFWLMRCLYQTIAHPRGGYMSTKLFVPRDVWRVKNVKLKGLDEKISACDLLTAALGKLAIVDTLDADAVLEEMQAFESVLDQVRINLSKKLGSEVGVQNPGSLFKGATGNDETTTGDVMSSKGVNMAGKSYLTSWRKLRNKSSGAGLTSGPSTSFGKDHASSGLTLSSLPMSSTLNTRPPRRRVSQIQCTGPNANYMAALARLFDAAQVLDQIARQVEDPGLKHSSKTHVGLELSTRNASEFFGFYICRFALNDFSMMLDKFIKRGSEWVLA